MANATTKEDIEAIMAAALDPIRAAIKKIELQYVGLAVQLETLEKGAVVSRTLAKAVSGTAKVSETGAAASAKTPTQYKSGMSLLKHLSSSKTGRDSMRAKVPDFGEVWAATLDKALADPKVSGTNPAEGVDEAYGKKLGGAIWDAVRDDKDMRNLVDTWRKSLQTALGFEAAGPELGDAGDAAPEAVAPEAAAAAAGDS